MGCLHDEVGEVCAFMVVLGEYLISNSLYSIAHLSSLLAEFDFVSTCLRGWSIISSMECPRKCGMSFLVIVMRPTASFSVSD